MLCVCLAWDILHYSVLHVCLFCRSKDVVAAAVVAGCACTPVYCRSCEYLSVCDFAENQYVALESAIFGKFSLFNLQKPVPHMYSTV